MMVAESRRGRRLVGRLDRGADVLSALADVCRASGVRAGELRATGAFEQVVLAEWDQRGRQLRPPRRFDAPFEILTLYGNISEKDGKPQVQARVALSRERDNGIEVVGGQLSSGRVFTLEFVIEAFDDILLRRLPDAQTGLALWREAQPVEAAVEPTPELSQIKTAPLPFDEPARTKWEDVVAASSSTPPAEPTAVEPPLGIMDADARVAPGDFIDHPKFGRVQVERIEGDYEFVSARLRNQRLIRLSLDVITLVLIGREGERQLFRAEMGR